MAISARALRAGKAVIEVGLLVKPVERQLRALQTRVQAVGKRLTSVGSFGIAGGGFVGLRNLFIGSTAAAAAAWPVKLAANLEIATAQLGTFTKNEESARNILIDLQKFSAVSMVPFDNLAQAAGMLIRFGVAEEQVGIHTKALAVLAAGNAEEFDKLSLAFAQVASAGKLQGEEMRQFKNTAFNPIREIAEATGETMDEVRLRMEAGTISFQEVANALQRVTGPTGRFGGLLARIADTLKGQFAKAMAQIRLAVLPLGEEALPILTKWLKAVNGIIPAMAAWIKANAGIVKTVLAVVAGVATLAVVTIATGLGFMTLSIAAAGLAAAIGAVASAFSALTTLPVLIGVLVAELVAYFAIATDLGRTLVQVLQSHFRALWDAAKKTFNGIADALKAGDIKLAAEIMWQGLKVAWLEGTRGLTIIWISFKNDLLGMFINMGAELEKAWINIATALKRSIFSTALDIGAFVQKIGKTDAQKRAIDKINEFAKNQFARTTSNETAAQIAQIEKLQALADKVLKAKTAAELRAAQSNLAAARKKLDELVKRAAALPGAELPDFGLGRLFPNINAGLSRASAAATPKGLFDPRLARQIFGAPQEDELAQLKKIERNTRRQGGLPAI